MLYAPGPGEVIFLESLDHASFPNVIITDESFFESNQSEGLYLSGGGNSAFQGDGL